MATFRQKIFAEHDAMRSLYVEIMKNYELRNNVEVIDSGALIPILRGNSVVIEKFVISNSTFGKDVFRLYLKIGAKAKLPDKAILPQKGTERVEMGSTNMSFKFGLPSKVQKPAQTQKTYSKNNNNNNGGGSFANVSINPRINSTMQFSTRLGNVVDYNKSSRSLVIEFKYLNDVLEALKILPFGIGYKLYLLDA